MSRFKPYLRYVILGGTFLFLIKALKDHWQEVAAIRIDAAGMALLIVALGVTLLAHIWSGWVWCWILRNFQQPIPAAWGIQAYLKTNIAKYIPGNIWHFYARIVAATDAGVAAEIATLSVLLEPLLMAAAALLIAIMGSQLENRGLQVLSLVVVLLAIHPKILNPIIQYLKRLKTQKSRKDGEAPQSNIQPSIPLNQDGKKTTPFPYPLLPLLGELGFLGLRGTGFLLTFMALNPWELMTDNALLSEVPQIFSAFSFAWLLGLIVPGAPGGIGIFEATAIALLKDHFSVGLILSAVALYRLISILAEAAGAGLAWLDEQRRS